MLEASSLKHASRMLPDLLKSADMVGTSCWELMLAFLVADVIGRNERRWKWNYTAVHFLPGIRPLDEVKLDELEPRSLQRSYPPRKSSPIWVAMATLYFPGLWGLVRPWLHAAAFNSDYTVCFKKMVSLVKILDRAEMRGISHTYNCPAEPDTQSYKMLFFSRRPLPAETSGSIQYKLT